MAHPIRTVATPRARVLSPPTLLLLGLLGAVLSVGSWSMATPERWEIFVAAMLAAGGVAWWIWRRGDVTVGVVLGAALLFRLAFAWHVPVLSDDAYRYVWDGLLQREGINPFLWLPSDPRFSDLQTLPLYEAMNSASYYSVYPPLSQLVFGIAGRLYAGDWLTSYYAVKAVFMALEFGGVLLLSRLVAPRALLLYAWHPLVLVEVAGQAHTEAALVFFIAAAAYAAHRGRGLWATAALTCAGWVKLVPFVLLPFAWRRYGWRSVAVTGVVSAVLVLPYFDPAVPGRVLQSLTLYVRYFEFNAGPYYAAKELLRLLTGDDWSKTLGPALGVLFAGSVPLLYLADRHLGWTLGRAARALLGLFLVLATTVHPWYLLLVLPLAPLARRPPWHWYALGLLSLGTYLFYAGGSYWPWVIGGWTAWALLLAARLWIVSEGEPRRWAEQTFYRALRDFQRSRAARKAARIERMLGFELNGKRILDLGAGEGFVGEALQRRHGADVVLADVVDLNESGLPLRVYDGRRLPFAEKQFDLVVLYFVLHHCEDAETVLREAVRVSRRAVFVAESVYTSRRERVVLETLDRWVNRLRSRGRMAAQEERLVFRTDEQWRSLFATLPVAVTHAAARGRWVHRQRYYVLDIVDS